MKTFKFKTNIESVFVSVEAEDVIEARKILENASEFKDIEILDVVLNKNNSNTVEIPIMLNK